MAIGLSHGGTTVYRSGASSEEVHVATMDGLVTLARRGPGHWDTVSHSLRGLHIQAIIFVGDTIFAGAYRDSVYASEDRGKTWERRDNGIGIRSVYSLASQWLDGHHRIYAGTEPPHLYFSDDLGDTWTQLPGMREVESMPTWRFASDPFTGHVKHINFDPVDPNHLYVSIEVGGLLESLDGGATWSQIPTPSPDVHRTVISPADPSSVYSTGGAGLLRLQKGSADWVVLDEKRSSLGSYPDMLVFVPSRSATMFLASCQFSPRDWYVDETRMAGGRIAKSEDAGESWSILGGGLPESFHGAVEAMCLEESASGGVVLLAGTIDGEVWCSEDSGDSWTKIADLAPIAKSVHWEIMTGTRRTALRFTDGVVLPLIKGA
jgi:photosystem II stability/assembly factor-like uncharacterized protein